MILREFLGIFSDFFIWRVLSENKVIHLPNFLIASPGLVPPKEVSGQLLAMSATFSDQLAVSELDNGSMDTAAAARKVTERLLSPSDAKMPSSKVQKCNTSVKSATLVSKSSMPSASQTSAPSSVKSSSRVTRQPSPCASNRMVDNQFLSLSAESISDTGQQLQNEISRTEEHHDSCSASSIISSDISSHGSEVHVLQRRETENNDTSENVGLLEEFQKVNKFFNSLNTKNL